jgi:hypothetical protein
VNAYAIKRVSLNRFPAALCCSLFSFCQRAQKLILEEDREKVFSLKDVAESEGKNLSGGTLTKQPLCVTDGGRK